VPKEDRYRRTRTWYARDRGRTTIEEVIEVLERGERRRLGLSANGLSTAAASAARFP
jgi:hypothetical protein